MLAIGLSATVSIPVNAYVDELLVLPPHQEFGPESCVGTLFSITVEVHDANNLYLLDVQFGWDTDWIEYVSHTKMIPIEQHPGGILHQPTIPVMDDVDENASMPGSAPGTMYWLDEVSMLPAEPFSGNGICFQMTFRIKKQPTAGEASVTTQLRVTSYTLADAIGGGSTQGIMMPIPPPPPYAEVVIHALLPTGPGDVNRDSKVDLLDIALAASLYGCTDGEPQWLPEADLAPLYGIIDISDLVTICMHYGKHYS